MNVVLGHLPLQNLDVVRPADFPNHLAQPQDHRAGEHLFAILGDPHKVLLGVKTPMRSRVAVLHSEQRA